MNWNDTLDALAPTHRWKMDESSGNLADSGSGGATLTATSLSYGQSPAILTGTAIDFSSGHAASASPLFGSGVALTFGGWVKIASGGSSVQRVMGQFSSTSARWLLNFSGTSDLFQILIDGTVVSASTSGIADSGWRFVVVTRSTGGEWSIYLDGVLDSTPTTIASSPPATTLDVGHPGGVQDLNGHGDEFFIINGTELTAEQVSALFDSRLATSGFNLSGGLVNNLTYNLSDSLTVIPEQELLR